MIREILVTEKCMVSYINEDDQLDDALQYANRIIIYETDKEDLAEALLDYIYNWDSFKMIDSHDEFDGECEDSEVVGISFL